jgi:anti-anti-sigma factor
VTAHPASSDLLHTRSFLTCPPGDRLREPTGGAHAHDHTVRVDVVGELDRSSAPTLIDAVTDAARNHEVLSPWTVAPAIRLDLHGLKFCDVGGIVALRDARAALLRHGCRLCLTSPGAPVLRLLDWAVRRAWLPGDVQCAADFPWPRVTAPLAVTAMDPWWTAAR